jgi:hypothetical protein
MGEDRVSYLRLLKSSTESEHMRLVQYHARKRADVSSVSRPLTRVVL